MAGLFGSLFGTKASRRGAGFAAVDRYCDVAGFSETEPVFYGHDASDCTLIEIEGVRTIMSGEEFENALQIHFVGGVSQLLKRAGHSLTISYESSANIEDDLERFVGAQRRNSDLKQLGVEAVTDEGEAIIRRAARRERILMAVWTSPKAALVEEVKRERAENAERWRTMPPARNASPSQLALTALSGPHAAAVRKVVDALEASQLRVRVLGPDEDGRRRDLTEIRKAVLYHETPDGWSPFGPTERTYPGAKPTVDDDTSELFSPPVAQQILSSGAIASANLRNIAMGGRNYAVVAVSVFPKILQHFNQLVASIVNHRAAGMPFRIAFHFEDIEGASGFGLRKVLAGLASWTSPTTKNLFQALRTLQEIHERDVDTVCKARIIATTWVEPGEPPEILEQRRSFLVRALMSWGDALVMEAPHNPMRALAETVPGMTMRAVVPPATLAPLTHAAAMLPFHRTAPIFSRGESVFLSTDGKLMPHEAFSADQNFWLSLIYATPGSGKSVLLNRLNYDFTAYSGGRRLPFISIIDVGVSSSGFIHVVQNALPEGRQHEATYVRLENAKHHAINPLELGLGRRHPLPREAAFVENFLSTLFGLRGPGTELSEQLITRVIRRLYQSKSDLDFSNTANSWQPGIEPELDRYAEELGLSLRDRTKWWQLVDGFMLAGKPMLAMRAQRYAMPRLEDVSAVLSESMIREDFPAPLVQMAQRSIESAVEKYPIFSNVTRLDLGEARIMSIDLQDVVQRFKSDEADRNNSLFFMAARQAFLSKIGGYAEEIRSMALPPGDLGRVYEAYWQAHYDDIAETPKRLAMDEYHLTGGTEGIARLVRSDAREGRKWGLEIILVSQLLEDFKGMKDMASTVMILNADSQQLREEARSVFGFTDAVKKDLERHVHGPRKGRGASFLVRYMLREEERWAVMTNLMGPRLLWALTTKKEDRLVRDELYRRVSVNEALRILAQRYPDASAIDHWERVQASTTDADTRIPKIIVDQIMGELLAGSGERPSGRPTTLLAAQ